MENLNYASPKTILFQRLSVEVTDFVLIGTLIYFFFSRVTSYQSSLLSFSLCVFAPGFLIVDHIHFQYNGYLIGLYLLSIVLLFFVSFSAFRFCPGSSTSCRVLFLLLHEFKTFILFPSPHFLNLSVKNVLPWREKFPPSLLSSLLSPRWDRSSEYSFCLSLNPAFFVSFYPVIRNDPIPDFLQVLSRLFPFQRGLLHAYWAPNFWALYAGLDRVAGFVVRKACAMGWLCGIPVMEGNSADGKVGLVHFSVLPEISSVLTMVLIAGIYIVRCETQDET